jgi:hypothetical protein
MVRVGGFFAAHPNNFNPPNTVNTMSELYSQESAHYTNEIELFDPD